MSGIRARAAEFYNSLDNRMRIIYGLSGFLLIVGITVGLFFLTQPNYVELMRGLSLENAGAITAKLDELQIPWKQTNGNTTIMVPEKQRDKALMELAVGGFTGTGEITFEDVLNKSSITMTNEEKARMYLMAQTTALSSAIRSLDGVENAIVNLQVSPDSAFVIANDDDAKASVILKLKSGYELKEDQVNGIVMILVNSVKGLKKENVTVTDSSGKQLNANEEDSDTFEVTNQMEMTQAVQEATEKRLKEFLATVYGKDNIEVSANVTLDFNSETSERIQFSPPIEGNEDGLVRSLSELSESVSGGTTGGAPGTDSNSEVTNYPTTDGSQSDYKKASKTINYELNQIKTNIEKAKGQIKDLSIAVIVNKKTLVGEEMTDEQKAELITLVAAAGGMDPKAIQVSAQEFAEKETVTISPEPAGFLGLPMWVLGAIAAAVVAGGVVVAMMMRRKSQSQAVQEEMAKVEAAELEEIDIDFRDKSSPKYQIEKYIDAKPEQVAALLRSWLNED